jgi:enoyl-CoA hydratase
MDTYQNINVQVENHIVTVRIDRPDKLNALNNITLTELKSIVQKAYTNPDIKALLITGTGEKAFIAGADISEIAALDGFSAKSFSENGQEIFKLIEDCPKPVMAALNGYTLGGGLELALSCHLRVASKHARMGLPEASLGIMPAFGGTQRLTQLVGKGKALEMMLTGKMISAEEALSIGLVNQVVENITDLLPSCIKLLGEMFKNAPLSLFKIITSANAAFQKEGFEVEKDCFVDLIETDDFAEGTQAFMEKRPPQFNGR